MIQAGPPTLTPTDPMEKKTKAGAPLTIQKVPVQLIPHRNAPGSILADGNPAAV